MTTEREAGGPATLADVAAAAGVSIPTASKALADRYDVAAGTKERVLRAAEALSFSPNVLARGLLTGRTQTVGIITSDIEGRFVPSIMLGAEDTLGADSSNVILCNSRGREDLEQHHARALLGRRVDGLIVVGNYPETRPPLKVRTRVPVVYVFAPCEDEDATSYVCDNRASARAATQAVIDSGKRRIAHVAGPRDAAAAQERAAGTLEALHDAGLEPIGGEPIWGDWLQRWGWDAVDRLLADRADFDAVVCGDDQIGRGVIERLDLEGVRVPEDVAIVGFDNWDVLSENTIHPFSSVDMNLRQLGELAATAIVQGSPVPGLHRVPGTLIDRGTIRGLD